MHEFLESLVRAIISYPNLHFRFQKFENSKILFGQYPIERILTKSCPKSWELTCCDFTTLMQSITVAVLVVFKYLISVWDCCDVSVVRQFVAVCITVASSADFKNFKIVLIVAIFFVAWHLSLRSNFACFGAFRMSGNSCISIPIRNSRLRRSAQCMAENFLPMSVQIVLQKSFCLPEVSAQITVQILVKFGDQCQQFMPKISMRFVAFVFHILFKIFIFFWTFLFGLVGPMFVPQWWSNARKNWSFSWPTECPQWWSVARIEKAIATATQKAKKFCNKLY